MLKYDPKRFWGLICNSKSTGVGVSSASFAEFNEKLYYDDTLPVDHFELPEDLDTARITSTEV